MRVCRTVATSLLGTLLLVPLMLAPAQAGSASRGARHDSQVPNASICGTARFDSGMATTIIPTAVAGITDGCVFAAP